MSGLILLARDAARSSDDAIYPRKRKGDAVSIPGREYEKRSLWCSITSLYSWERTHHERASLLKAS